MPLEGTFVIVHWTFVQGLSPSVLCKDKEQHQVLLRKMALMAVNAILPVTLLTSLYWVPEGELVSGVFVSGQGACS